MAKPIGPKKVHRYGDAFKATAVKLSQLSGGQVQNVAEALDIHPHGQPWLSRLTRLRGRA